MLIDFAMMPLFPFQLFTQIHSLTFTARSLAGSQMNWNTTGTGSVVVRTNHNQIDFDERIVMSNGMICHDQKRWQYSDNHLIFKRWRNNDYEPIFQFHHQNGLFVPQQSYWCAPDDYSATLVLARQSIIFTIYIRSTRKNECLQYKYITA